MKYIVAIDVTEHWDYPQAGRIANLYAYVEEIVYCASTEENYFLEYIDTVSENNVNITAAVGETNELSCHRTVAFVRSLPRIEYEGEIDWEKISIVLPWA